ncbi:hypothetical protein [Streptomyces sp. SCL15-4]|uniref:hypothetical protein n=1 Tax=Streptomyces sp. SCL15-4 TaxID=2967221 RepID=UPI00296753EB|nr:hypothetical protein [Streptomyces sp. SCL15-4]
MTQQPVYATRENVQRAMDSKPTARSSAQIDRALQSASRDVEHLCHRRFYPEQGTRYFDWPESQYRPSWRLWLDDSELISLTSVSSGGVTIPLDDVLLEPNRSGPPYNRVEINIGTSVAWGGGSTHQRDITITGLWGYRNDETTAGTLTGAVSSTTATTVAVDGPAAAVLGVGSVIRVDSERMLVTGRTMAATGQTLGGSGLTAQQNNVALTVADGSGFAVDEVLLIESERVLIVDIAGSTLTVRRGWDGSVLAAHPAGTDIYASRSLAVARGALGTTAATHANGSSVVRWDPPGLVRDLVIAEAIGRLTSETSGYTRALRAGETGERNRDHSALTTLRQAVYDAVGRKARMRSV